MIYTDKVSTNCISQSIIGSSPSCRLIQNFVYLKWLYYVIDENNLLILGALDPRWTLTHEPKTLTNYPKLRLNPVFSQMYMCIPNSLTTAAKNKHFVCVCCGFLVHRVRFTKEKMQLYPCPLKKEKPEQQFLLIYSLSRSQTDVKTYKYFLK